MTAPRVVSPAKPADPDAELRAKLALSRRAGRAQLLRVVILPFAAGLALLIGGVVWLVLSPRGSAGWYTTPTLLLVSILLINTAVPPRSSLLVRACALAMCALFAAFGAAQTHNALASAPPDGTLYECGTRQRHELTWVYIHVWLFFGLTCLSAIGSVGSALMASYGCACGGAPAIGSRQLLEAVWWQVGVVLMRAALGLVYFVALGFALIDGFVHTGDVVWNLLMAAGSFGVGLGHLLPRVRRGVHACLTAADEGTRAAAGIAALLSGQDETQTISRARARLRAIPADRLTRAVFELADVGPPSARADGSAREEPGLDTAERQEPAWYARSVSVQLDEIDAFVSHSWHDDPAYKWEALQQWRARFKARNKEREPLLWIDRCCINQDDIATELLLVPVYLASCQRLLILAGPTYLTRLWCVAEVFVFDQMTAREHAVAQPPDVASQGSRVDQRSREHLATGRSGKQPHHPDGTSADSTPTRRDPRVTAATRIEMEVLPGFDADLVGSFSVDQCSCTLPEDYDRLASAIEVACGSLPRFSERAVLLLQSAPKRTPDLSHVQPSNMARAHAHEPPAPGSFRRASSLSSVLSPRARTQKLQIVAQERERGLDMWTLAAQRSVGTGLQRRLHPAAQRLRCIPRAWRGPLASGLLTLVLAAAAAVLNVLLAVQPADAACSRISTQSLSGNGIVRAES